jgi:hypothetical protein
MKTKRERKWQTETMRDRVKGRKKVENERNSRKSECVSEREKVRRKETREREREIDR